MLGFLCEMDKSVASSCCAIGFLERLFRASIGSCLCAELIVGVLAELVGEGLGSWTPGNR